MTAPEKPPPAHPAIWRCTRCGLVRLWQVGDEKFQVCVKCDTARDEKVAR